MQHNPLMQESIELQSDCLVYVIDDQELCLFTLHAQLEGAGYRVKSYRSPETFLEDFCDQQIGCIIVDYRMPSMSGVELVKNVRQRGSQIPFIVVTGYGTVSMAVELMQMGAISVLEKPYRQEQLVSCVENAIALDLKERRRSEQAMLLKQRLTRLTLREMDVLRRVQEGRLTKQIGLDLNISSKTVEVHRSNIIKKMEVDSLMQLIQWLASTKIDLGNASC